MNELYEAYKLLDNNGFAPTDENVRIMCEGLENGTITFLDGANLSLTEGMAEDYYYMQLLDKNGYTVTERNVRILKEGIENGKFLVLGTEFLTEEEGYNYGKKKSGASAGVKSVAGTVAKTGALVGGAALGTQAVVQGAKLANRTQNAIMNGAGVGKGLAHGLGTAGAVGGAALAAGAIIKAKKKAAEARKNSTAGKNGELSADDKDHLNQVKSSQKGEEAAAKQEAEHEKAMAGAGAK